jgi:hypothetical protein
VRASNQEVPLASPDLNPIKIALNPNFPGFSFFLEPRGLPGRETAPNTITSHTHLIHMQKKQVKDNGEGYELTDS